MSIKKSYLASKPECKVTFKLDKKEVNSAGQASLVGDFNEWDIKKTPMKKLKSGDFSVTISLKKDHEYQFKYVIDDSEWVNEPEADKYQPNEFQGENSVLVV